MTGSQEVFETLVEWDSKLHMVLGDKSQLEIQGSGVVPFRMETGCVMWVQDVLFVLGLKYSVIFVSMIERKGFEVLLEDGKARLRPRGSKSNGVVLRVREHGFYKLTSKPVDHGKKQGWVLEKQEQVQASEEQVQVPVKNVHLLEQVQVPETDRESSSRGSLQIQRETRQAQEEHLVSGEQGCSYNC